MKKLQQMFDDSLKNYADTRELDYKKKVHKQLKDDQNLSLCKLCGNDFYITDLHVVHDIEKRSIHLFCDGCLIKYNTEKGI